MRAAEVEAREGLADVVRFGQVTLQPGAVVNGEIVDSDAVSSALRRLWEAVDFSTTSVVLGVGNSRVIVRQADLPAMAEQDLGAALGFEIGELIPLPPDDATFDFQVLDDFINESGENRVRLLIAAAQRSMLERHLAAVKGAGLSVARVDPLPLALVRCLARPPGIGEPDPVEAMVSVGAGVTTVVVHERGVPRFARFLNSGGGDITQALSLDLGMEQNSAEDLKRRVAAGRVGIMERNASGVVTAAVGQLATDIAASVEFYQAQAGRTVDRVLLTGGGARTAGLLDRLESDLRRPIQTAVLPEAVRLVVDLDEGELDRALVNMPSVVGLALGGVAGQRDRRIDLLPAEAVVGREERRQARNAALALGALAAVLVGAWAYQGTRVSSEKKVEAQAETQMATLQRQETQLAPVGQLQTAVSQRRQVVATALTGDIGWTQLMESVAAATPADVYMTSFQGTAAAPGSPNAAAGGTTAQAGTVNFSLSGVDHTSAARWLQQVGALPSISGLWVPTSSESSGRDTFSSSGNVTNAAHANRQSQYLGGPS